MSSLTAEAMAKLLQAHQGAEYARDLDQTMATIGPEVLWEWHPLGLRITNRDSVREMYRLLYEHYFPHATRGTERMRIYGDDVMVVEVEVELNIDGQLSDACLISVLSFVEGYLTSERIYVSGVQTGLVEKAFAGPFRELPGVVDLARSSESSNTAARTRSYSTDSRRVVDSALVQVHDV
jgi:hypothetical protein